ncbi:glycoside hydrolase family 16 protein [Salinimicrobium gaetbulicola]|uniref:Family 16 glycosylhydrolase n=1 Tax=Salinimicrobium gaetbulicola TaxID=999702 RepID=A0ABW3IGS5_9FLAO
MIRTRFYILSIITLISFKVNAQVIFEENFDGNQLNMDHWNYEEGDGCPGNCGWGNRELQIYDRNYVEVKDGNLVITAVKKGDKYFSGKINSKDRVEILYGEIEVRAKVAQGKGLWPAVWMLGCDIDEVSWPAAGEIDIMEYVGKEPQRVFTSLHTPASHGNTINTKKVFIEDIEEGFHIYKAVWTEKSIEFFIDGNSVYKFIPEKYDDEHYPYRKPFYFLINMAIGGSFGGPEVDDSIFPKKFYVDYIKVTKL